VDFAGRLTQAPLQLVQLVIVEGFGDGGAQGRPGYSDGEEIAREERLDQLPYFKASKLAPKLMW
jgi:hypothetical protein